MRKRAAASILVFAFVISCLTGCTFSKGFNSSALVKELETFGLQRMWTTTDGDYLRSTLEGKNTPSSYYICEGQEESKFGYDEYMHAKGFPTANNVKNLLIGVVKEKYDKNTYISNIYLVEFDNKEDAEALYRFAVSACYSHPQHKTGEEKGYQYALGFYGDKNIAAGEGTYMCGSSVLIISTVSRNGDKNGINYRIYKDLDMADPGILSEG